MGGSLLFPLSDLFTLFQHQREANVIFMSWIKG